METLDKTYLELSQITTARNERELQARNLMKRIIKHLNNPAPHLSDDSDTRIADDAHMWLMNDMGSDETVKWQEGLS